MEREDAGRRLQALKTGEGSDIFSVFLSFLPYVWSFLTQALKKGDALTHLRIMLRDMVDPIFATVAVVRASHSQNSHIYAYFTTIWRRRRPKYSKNVRKMH